VHDECFAGFGDTQVPADFFDQWNAPAGALELVDHPTHGWLCHV
jgi:hypothetical protein